MRYRQTCAVRRARRPLPRPRVLPLALMLGLSTSHVSAQTIAHANGVALAAIEAISKMATQSADKAHAADVMQAAIQAVTTIATTTVHAQASVDTARAVNGGVAQVVPLPAPMPNHHVPGYASPEVIDADVIDVDVIQIDDGDVEDMVAEVDVTEVDIKMVAPPVVPEREAAMVAAVTANTTTDPIEPIVIESPPVVTVKPVATQAVVAEPVAAEPVATEPVQEPVAVAAPFAAVAPEPDPISEPAPEPAPTPVLAVPVTAIKPVDVQAAQPVPSVPRAPVAAPPALPQAERAGAGATTTASAPVAVSKTTSEPLLEPAIEPVLDALTEPEEPEPVAVLAPAVLVAVNGTTTTTPTPPLPPVAEPLAAPAPMTAPEPAPAPRRPAASGSAPVKFNTSMLVFPVDVDLFAEGNPVLPGSYRLDVQMNGRWQGKFDVPFENLKPGDRIAQPCFDKALLQSLGLDLTQISAEFAARLDAGERLCGVLDSMIPGASYTYDSGEQVLRVSAPQITLLRTARGYVDPSRWDGGINAALLSYSYNGWHNKPKGLDATTSHYLGLRAGVNLGDWRFRYRATLTHGNKLGLQTKHDAVYAERALGAIKSALTLGEANTDGRVFDALGFRGVSLQTDTRMMADSQNGFAPVIRGIAQSNAKVTIHQRGSQIFETTVPPGPFVIDDLYPNGQGGDLLVTITEADGSTRSFTETYSSLPELLRPGVLHYSATGGRYRSANLASEPYFGLLTARLGVNNTVTAYGGVLFAQGYDAATGGVGLNLPIGAVTLDGTYARTFLPGKTVTGTGWRLAYTKRLDATDTDVTLAMLRYANRGFYEPTQAFDLIDRVKRGEALTPEQRRAQLSLNLSQPLPGNWGSLSFSGSMQTYWNRKGRDLQYNLGYGRNVGRVSASLNASRTRLTDGRWDNQVMLGFSLPLGPQSTSRAFLNTSYTRRREGQSAQASVSGTLGENSLVSYNLFGSSDKNKGSSVMTNGGASLGWTNSIARVGASASTGNSGSQQYGLSASGGVVAFRDGVLLAPEVGETVAIVQARRAQGAAVPQARGARLDARGHALVGNLQPYRENTVNIDPKGLSTDVALLNTSQKVAPTAGAVTLLKYQTQHGYSVLVLGRREDGSTLPFAAGVFDESGKSVGYVGQGGQALLRVEAERGQLQVKWGAKPEEQCRFDYDLGVRDNKNTATDAGAGFGAPLRQLEVRCL